MKNAEDGIWLWIKQSFVIKEVYTRQQFMIKAIYVSNQTDIN